MTLTSHKLRLSITGVRSVKISGMYPSDNGFVFILTQNDFSIITQSGYHITTQEEPT
jgi:hypothetical protein